MALLKQNQLQCMNCKTWFASPIQFADSGTFETASMAGNQFKCPKCGTWVPCNKENMRWVQSDGQGGFVGIDTA